MQALHPPPAAGPGQKLSPVQEPVVPPRVGHPTLTRKLLLTVQAAGLQEQGGASQSLNHGFGLETFGFKIKPK